MRLAIPRISWTALAWPLAAAVLLLALIDGGSVVLTQIAVPDKTLEVGHAAAGAAEGKAHSQHTAVVAYDAASLTAGKVGMRVARKGFTVAKDGEVTLTVTRTAPTLAFQHLPFLRDFAVVHDTQTVSALPYS